MNGFGKGPWGRGPWGGGASDGGRWERQRQSHWGAPRPSWDRHRVYRDTERGWIAGVCAGIADYLETEPALVRAATVLCLVFFFLPTIIAYAAFAMVLKPKPPALFASVEEEAFWRGMRAEPAGALHGLDSRFRALDRRLARAEGLFASDEFELRRGFRDLGES